LTVQGVLVGKNPVLLSRRRWLIQSPLSLQIACSDQGDDVQGNTKRQIALGGRVSKVTVLHDQGRSPPQCNPSLLLPQTRQREVLPVNAAVQLADTSLQCPDINKMTQVPSKSILARQARFDTVVWENAKIHQIRHRHISRGRCVQRGANFTRPKVTCTLFFRPVGSTLPFLLTACPHHYRM